ncbi:MAG: lamin tail domain-containing protein [Candidatus Promineifilaceae bacterium]|nr:lamin tail domain-containing protein [Candidatus Promineifilaceae bacterium]
MNHLSRFHLSPLPLFLILLALLVLPVAEGRAQDTPPLLLTEVYYDTPGTDADEEWAELVSLAAEPLALAGYGLTDEETPGQMEGAVRFPDGATAAPGEVLVVAQTATGFRALFGANPTFELRDSDPAVPDMVPDAAYAGGDFALANDGDELFLLSPADAILDAVAWEESVALFNPPVAGVARGASIERVAAGCDTDTAVDWQAQAVPSPGQVALAEACPAAVGDAQAGGAPVVDEGLLPIGAIQGAGEASPYQGEAVAFRGIVTGFFEDRNSRGDVYYTLFVQEPAAEADADAATSDGIAVFLGRRPPAVEIGDEVLVRGEVTEYYGLTEIEDDGLRLEVLSENNPLPDPVPLDPTAPAAELERLESVRVRLDEGVVTGPTYSACALFVLPPDQPRVLRERLQDPLAGIVPVQNASEIDCTAFPQATTGDTLENITGPLIYSFELFRIVVQTEDEEGRPALSAGAAPALPEPPPTGAEHFAIASFNLYDYFDTVSDTGWDAEPVPDEAELDVKQAKLVQTIADVLGCPTILGVQEVENEMLLRALTEQLEPLCGFRYTVTHRESPDARGIDVALLTDPERVAVIAAELRQVCSEILSDVAEEAGECPMGEDPLFSRPPLVAELLVEEAPYTVVVNHFKSKRGGERETAPRRLAQAEHVRALVEEALAVNPQARVAVLGDLNDYALSPPLLTLTEAGPLVNPLMALPAEERYSYTFSGAAQLLDYVLLTPAAAEEATWTGIMHINADYPVGLAGNADVPFRVSDHDIPVVVLSAPDVMLEVQPTPLVDVAPAVEEDEPDVDVPGPEVEDVGDVAEVELERTVEADEEPEAEASPAVEEAGDAGRALLFAGLLVLLVLLGTGVLVMARRR